jgi:asparagine synthase (glutamine-hydrolysing)
MGGFFYINRKICKDAERKLEDSRACFREAGFRDPVALSGETYALDFYGKISSDIVNLVETGEGSFLASVGTLIYGDAVGTEALRNLHEASRSRPMARELERCLGQFALIVGTPGEVTVHRDPNSSYEIFHTADLGLVSSSFLAVATALERRSVDPASVLEFVFNGVTLGTGTPIKQVRKMDLGETLHLSATPTVTTSRPDFSPPVLQGTVEEMTEQVFEALSAHTRRLVRIFGDNMTMALSGGYDTRLLLALFRDAGTIPRLFVYGPPGSQDVRIAGDIARAEGLPIEVVDKSLPLYTSLDSFAAMTRRNFFIYDGYSQIWIFSRDREHDARAARHAGGALNVHGGAGEVLRNFFGLPDRPIAVDQVIAAFFSQFDRRMCRNPEDIRLYEASVASKIADVFGQQQPVLSRQQVEALYPHLRCRSWFGRDNSINARAGYSNLPFYESFLVDLSLRIPLRHKNFGDFQSRLIRRADPALARHMSQYGHNFAADAPLRQRTAGWLGHQRPAFVRRNMYRLRRLGKREAPGQTPFGAQILELLDGVRIMSRYFDMAAVSDLDHFTRICTLEYLFRFLSAE